MIKEKIEEKAGFLKNSKNEKSSKRLGYLSTVPFSTVGTIWLCSVLVHTNHPKYAVDVWNSFLIFSAVLGGFVSMELLPNIIGAFKRGKVDESDKENS